jgi:hypothetical protein
MWRQGFYNNRIMLAQLWAQHAGVGFIQYGFDPTANRGRGEVWIDARDPSSVKPDPAATDDVNWAYVIMEDRMYLEEVRQRWPERGFLVRPKAMSKADTSGDNGFRLPDGPMSVVGGLPDQKSIGDGRVKVRWLYAKDPSVEEVKVNPEVKKQIEKLQQIVLPTRKPMFPNGRLVIECEGIILADGANPFPKQKFPLVRFLGNPVLTGFYPPPPVRFSKSLQDLAGRMYTQLFENAVRLNNGTTYIPENCGISGENFGGLPGEVHVINAQSNPPQTTWPAAMPQHFTALPQLLLDKQKELQGFTPSRMGEAGQGNVSGDLYQGTIFQSKNLTRMRGRLMSESIQKLAEGVFYTAAKFFKNSPEFPMFNEGQPDSQESFAMQKWDDISGEADNYNVYLDPGSIRPMSGAALKMMVPQLRQLGLLDTQTALEIVDVPGAAEIASNLRTEQQLAALANVQKRK